MRLLGIVVIVVFFRIVSIFFLLFEGIGKVFVGVLHMAVGLIQTILIEIVLLVLNLFLPVSFIEVEFASFPNGLIFSLFISFPFLSPCRPSGCFCEFASIAHGVFLAVRLILLAIQDKLVGVVDKCLLFEGWIEGDDQRIGV